MNTHDPAPYLELWVPVQDVKDATGKTLGVKRVLKARVPLGEAIGRGARALCYHRTECDTYWDERPETHDDWWRSAEAVLQAALGAAKAGALKNFLPINPEETHEQRDTP